MGTHSSNTTACEFGLTTRGHIYRPALKPSWPACVCVKSTAQHSTAQHSMSTAQHHTTVCIRQDSLQALLQQHECMAAQHSTAQHSTAQHNTSIAQLSAAQSNTTVYPQHDRLQVLGVGGWTNCAHAIQCAHGMAVCKPLVLAATR